MQRRSLQQAVLAAATLFAGAGCGPPEPYINYSGLSLAPRTLPSNIQVLRSTTPGRPYRELGTIQVSCPTETKVGAFWSVSTEGGCSYVRAISLAMNRAAGFGADGIFNVEASAASNGNIVSLVATAFRYTAEASEADDRLAELPQQSGTLPQSAKPAESKLPVIEERLRYLKVMLEKGLISQDEYERRRADILKDL